MKCSQLLEICNDLGMMAPKGPLTPHTVSVVHSSYKAQGQDGLSFQEFKSAMETLARKSDERSQRLEQELKDQRIMQERLLAQVALSVPSHQTYIGEFKPPDLAIEAAGISERISAGILPVIETHRADLSTVRTGLDELSNQLQLTSKSSIYVLERVQALEHSSAESAQSSTKALASSQVTSSGLGTLSEECRILTQKILALERSRTSLHVEAPQPPSELHVPTVQPAITVLNQQVQTLHTTMEGLQKQVHTLHTLREGLQEQVLTSSTGLNSMQETVEGLPIELRGLKDRISSVEDTLKSMTIATIKGIGAESSPLSVLQPAQTDLDLQGRLATAEAAATEAFEEVRMLKSRMSMAYHMAEMASDAAMRATDVAVPRSSSSEPASSLLGSPMHQLLQKQSVVSDIPSDLANRLAAVEAAAEEADVQLHSMEQLPQLVEELAVKVQGLTNERTQKRSSEGSGNGPLGFSGAFSSTSRHHEQMLQLKELIFKVQALDSKQYVVPQELEHFERRLQEQLAQQQQQQLQVQSSVQVQPMPSSALAQDMAALEVRLSERVDEMVLELRQQLEALRRHNEEQQSNLQKVPFVLEEHVNAIDARLEALELVQQEAADKLQEGLNNETAALSLAMTDLKMEVDQQLHSMGSQSLSAALGRADEGSQHKLASPEMSNGADLEGSQAVTHTQLMEAMQDVYNEIDRRFAKNSTDTSDLSQQQAAAPPLSVSSATELQKLLSTAHEKLEERFSDFGDHYEVTTASFKSSLKDMTQRVDKLEEEVSELQNSQNVEELEGRVGVLTKGLFLLGEKLNNHIASFTDPLASQRASPHNSTEDVKQHPRTLNEEVLAGGSVGGEALLHTKQSNEYRADSSALFLNQGSIEIPYETPPVRVYEPPPVRVYEPPPVRVSPDSQEAGPSQGNAHHQAGSRHLHPTGGGHDRHSRAHIRTSEQFNTQESFVEPSGHRSSLPLYTVNGHEHAVIQGTFSDLYLESGPQTHTPISHKNSGSPGIIMRERGEEGSEVDSSLLSADPLYSAVPGSSPQRIQTWAQHPGRDQSGGDSPVTASKQEPKMKQRGSLRYEVNAEVQFVNFVETQQDLLLKRSKSKSNMSPLPTTSLAYRLPAGRVAPHLQSPLPVLGSPLLGGSPMTLQRRVSMASGLNPKAHL
ncbi:hypothetical protein CEUSTIGMA_g7968.t1 [Chlamydomonas eustigma]|uniref:EF-hand domain-containing protein n=1 Tax=Chlamydomonas eustigma TaxID=1157962 RepID=A0A250XCP9_9CHLO|nr:hypothetical protein CEUSTIGMA_g7968.t1 [Chlamydomonas eustigma]|eukprot:GAX80530.1 hypothetical protein CEUSTIGMA_g7968.t1 [Chlamydomonas eustigma]